MSRSLASYIKFQAMLFHYTKITIKKIKYQKKVPSNHSRNGGLSVLKILQPNLNRVSMNFEIPKVKLTALPTLMVLVHCKSIAEGGAYELSRVPVGTKLSR